MVRGFAVRKINLHRTICSNMTYNTQKPITGTLRLIGDRWHFIPNNLVQHKILAVYKHDQALAEKINSNSNLGFEVDALLIDEFSHPELFRDVIWGMGVYCYKLVNTENL